mgnify:CR=1 FL=1
MVNVIDYMPGDTLLHRLNPVVKLGLAAAIIIGIFLSDTYVALLGFLALTLALAPMPVSSTVCSRYSSC